MKGLAVLAVLAACSGEGRALREWTVESQHRSPHAVTLPSTLFDELPAGNVDFSLHTSVTLRDIERGYTLTLALDCFHGPLVLESAGTPLDDIGDVGVGEHRFIVPEALTRGPQLAFTLSGRRIMPDSAWGFASAPRLVIGARVARSTAASFNRALGVATSAISAVMVLIFGVLFALDRRRRTYGLIAVGALVMTAVSLWGIGITPAWIAGGGIFVWALSQLYFVHLEFGLGGAPRWLAIACTVTAAAYGATPFSYKATRIVVIGSALVTIPYWSYLFAKLAGIARSGKRSADALILMFGACVSVLLFVPWVLAVGPGISIGALGGYHLETIGIATIAACYTVILAREHATRSRALAATAAELQRQVAERSRDLAEALGKLAHQAPSATVVDRMIDGRYRVMRRIGAGGMGVVYEVERIADAQRLALKTLRGHADREALARFAREAQIAAEVVHPNILPILDVGIADGGLFIAMPLVDGGSLEQQRARFGDVAWARRHLAHVAAGLAELHARKIVHRDLKPANVLLQDSVARIADFGLAATRPGEVTGASLSAPPDIGVQDTVAKPALTEVGDVFGTPKYMAPELAAGVHDYAASADIFAFGLIAYEMLTGKAPFTIPPFLTARRGEPIQAPDVSMLDAVIARCLSLEASHRPAAGDIVAALTGALNH